MENDNLSAAQTANAQNDLQLYKVCNGSEEKGFIIWATNPTHAAKVANEYVIREDFGGDIEEWEEEEDESVCLKFNESHVTLLPQNRAIAFQWDFDKEY